MALATASEWRSAESQEFEATEHLFPLLRLSSIGHFLLTIQKIQFSLPFNPTTHPMDDPLWDLFLGQPCSLE